MTFVQTTPEAPTASPVMSKHPLSRWNWSRNCRGRRSEPDDLAISKAREIDPGDLCPSRRKRWTSHTPCILPPWLVPSSTDIRKRYYDLSIGSDWSFHETPYSFTIKGHGWFKVNFQRITPDLPFLFIRPFSLNTCWIFDCDACILCDLQPSLLKESQGARQCARFVVILNF